MGIDYSPASVNSQFQNPVEREVQTVNKGVATLFADQHLLNSSFWTYVLNHWICQPMPHLSLERRPRWSKSLAGRSISRACSGFRSVVLWHPQRSNRRWLFRESNQKWVSAWALMRKMINLSFSTCPVNASKNFLVGMFRPAKPEVNDVEILTE